MKRFDYKSMDEEQVAKVNVMRNGVKELFKVIEEQCPNSREKSLAVTKLEELAMWANKAISHTE